MLERINALRTDLERRIAAHGTAEADPHSLRIQLKASAEPFLKEWDFLLDIDRRTPFEPEDMTQQERDGAAELRQLADKARQLYAL